MVSPGVALSAPVRCQASYGAPSRCVRVSRVFSGVQAKGFKWIRAVVVLGRQHQAGQIEPRRQIEPAIDRPAVEE